MLSAWVYSLLSLKTSPSSLLGCHHSQKLQLMVLRGHLPLRLQVQNFRKCLSSPNITLHGTQWYIFTYTPHIIGNTKSDCQVQIKIIHAHKGYLGVSQLFRGVHQVSLCPQYLVWTSNFPLLSGMNKATPRTHKETQEHSEIEIYCNITIREGTIYQWRFKRVISLPNSLHL